MLKEWPFLTKKNYRVKVILKTYGTGAHTHTQMLCRPLGQIGD